MQDKIILLNKFAKFIGLLFGITSIIMYIFLYTINEMPLVAAIVIPILGVINTIYTLVAYKFYNENDKYKYCISIMILITHAIMIHISHCDVIYMLGIVLITYFVLYNDLKLIIGLCSWFTLFNILEMIRIVVGHKMLS